MQHEQLKRRPLHVAIVSRNPETLEGLESYLQGAGAITSSARAIARAPVLAAATAALVVFPDDYPWEGAVAALERCRAENPRVPVVLVTRTPRRFDALALADAGALTVVIPKPAWSWTILDAIRAHLDGGPAPDGGAGR